MSTLSGGPNIVVDGLVLHLDVANVKSYPGSGTTWRDLSRGSNNGTLVNGPTFDSGNGGSIVFDGVNDYVNFLTFLTSNYWPENGDWTVSSFHNIAGNVSGNTRSALFANQRFRTETDNGGPGGFGVNLINGNYCMNLSHDDGLGTTTSYEAHTLIPIITGSSVEITYTWEGNAKTAKACKNGILISTTTNASYKWSPRSIGITSRVGTSTQGGWTNYFPGVIYTIRVWNRALSSTEILQNYNATKTRFGL
jgi:hypothetical protein